MLNTVRSPLVCPDSHQRYGTASNRRLRVLGAWTIAALTLAAAGHPAPSADASASQPSPCTVVPDKVASPSSLDLGQEVTVRLTLEAACPSAPPEPAEVILAIDRSASMNEEGRFPATIAAAEGFVRLAEFGPLRIGVLTFSDDINIFGPQATVHLALSAERDQVLATLAGLTPPLQDTLWTNLTAAIQSGQTALTGPDARPNTRRVLILLTDGDHNALPFFVGPPEDAAQVARAAGVVIYTIGLGVSDDAAARLIAIAGAPERFFRAPTTADLESVYRAVGMILQSSGLGDVEVVDLLPASVQLVAGSVSPPPYESTADRLVWRVPRVGTGGWSASYRVLPLEAGTYATNISARAEYTDADGTRTGVDFPIPTITVRRVAAYTVYLPTLLTRFCKPAHPFDVVLALDNSSSMDGEKALRARTAAAEFLTLLSMPPTQASVLAFHDEAELVQPLTPDRRLAQSALIGLPGGVGTRIDRALDAATDELTGSRRASGNLPVMILLTDGQQTGAPESRALDAAARAREAGITVFTIGIGGDVSADLLTEIAGHPARYYPAAGPEALRRVYLAIAGALPCEMP